MATIKEDIVIFSEMIVNGFKADKLNLDYSLTSFKDIDTFTIYIQKMEKELKAEDFPIT